jgi:hypothetical protein
MGFVRMAAGSWMCCKVSREVVDHFAGVVLDAVDEGGLASS